MATLFFADSPREFIGRHHCRTGPPPKLWQQPLLVVYTVGLGCEVSPIFAAGTHQILVKNYDELNYLDCLSLFAALGILMNRDGGGKRCGGPFVVCSDCMTWWIDPSAFHFPRSSVKMTALWMIFSRANTICSGHDSVCWRHVSLLLMPGGTAQVLIAFYTINIAVAHARSYL